MTAAGNDPPTDMNRMLFPNNDQMPHIQGGTFEKHLEAGMIPQYLMDSVDFTQTPMGFIGRTPSDATHPTLEQPLFSLRMASSAALETGITWETAYQDLLNSLSESDQAWMQEQSLLPKDEQSDAYGAFKGMLEFAAKGKTWLNEVSQSAIPDTRLEASWQMAKQALLGTLTYVETFLASGRDFLQTTGANHPNFDVQLNYLNQMEELLSALQQADGDEVAQLAGRTALLSAQFQSAAIGHDMQIMGPLLAVLEMTTAASLLNPSLQPLYLGLTAATLNMRTADSQIGFVGDDLAALQQGLTDWLTKTFMPNMNAAEGQLSAKLASSGLLLALVCALAVCDGAAGGSYE